MPQLFLLLGLTAELGVRAVAAEARGSIEGGRKAKSLRDTFPFNHHEDDHDHGDHHAHDHAHHEGVTGSRASRQGQGDDIQLDIGTIAAAGERCIDKVTKSFFILTKPFH